MNALPDLQDVLKKSFKTNSEATLLSDDKPADELEQQKEAPAEKVVEEKKAEEKKPEAKAFSEISDEEESEQKKEETLEELARAADEKDSAFIKRLKKEVAANRNKIKQLEEQIAKRPKADGSTLEELRKQLEEREAIIERRSYQDSAAFQNAFGKPIAKAEEATRDLVGQFTETKGVYERASALRGKERMEYLKEHTEDGAGAIFNRLAQIDELVKDRDATLQDRATISKTLEQEQKSGESARIIAAFEAKKEDMQKRFSAYRSEKAGDMLKQAQALLSGDAPEADVIAAAYFAPMVPHYLDQIKTLRAENAALKARVGEDNEEAGKVGGRGADTGRAQTAGIMEGGKLKPMQQMLKDGFKILAK